MQIEKSITFVSPFLSHLLSDDCSFGGGGAERQFFLFGRALALKGWRVSFITRKSKFKVAQHNKEIFSIYPIDFKFMGGSNIYLPRDWMQLFLALFKADSTYNVLKTPGHLLAPMSFFCKLQKKILVFWSQNGTDATPAERDRKNSFANILQNFGIRRSDIIIAQSKEQEIRYYQNYAIKAHLVPSICEDLEMRCSTSQASILSKPIDILWVGNSTSNKRPEVLFELAKLLSQRQFAMAMSDSHTKRYNLSQLEADRLPNVQFLGSLHPIKMDKWFKKTWLFLNTSEREGFPNTFLQSWMNKVPVISLNIDPDRIISKNGFGEVAATPDEIKAIGKDYLGMAKLLLPIVESLLASRKKIKIIGDRASKYIEKHHTPNRVLPILLNLLEISGFDNSHTKSSRKLKY